MSESNRDRDVSLFFLLFAGLIGFVLILSKWLHERPVLNSFVSEAALVLLIGISVSFFVHYFLFDKGELADDWDEDDEDDDGKMLAHWLLSFQSNVFFMALLPPILFNSGYQLRRELFYRHIKPILLFSSIGTIISALFTTFCLYAVLRLGWMNDFSPPLLELMTFGALIAATDTVSTLAVFQAKRVDPQIFYVVFGESALNDAVSLVLFKTLSDFLLEDKAEAVSLGRHVCILIASFFYQAICSPILGLVASFCTAMLFKHNEFRTHKVLELSLYMLLMYIPFIIAETCHLSGIVTIFFSGMSARRYVQPNVSEDTSRSAEVIFHLAAYLAETCIFLELGLSVFGLSQSFNWGFIGWAIVASFIGRAMSIYPISFAYNWSLGEFCHIIEDDTSIASGSSLASWKLEAPRRRQDLEISSSMMHILWFAGVRGAVSYACVRDFPNVNGNKEEFIAATMVIVLITIIIMGGATETLLGVLKIEMDVDTDAYMRAWQKRRRLKGPFHRFEYEYIYCVAVREDCQEDIHPMKNKNVRESHEPDPFHYVADPDTAAADPIVGMPLATVPPNRSTSAVSILATPSLTPQGPLPPVSELDDTVRM